MHIAMFNDWMNYYRKSPRTTRLMQISLRLALRSSRPKPPRVRKTISAHNHWFNLHSRMYLRRNRESYRQRRGLGSCRLLWTGLILVAYLIILPSHRMQAKLSTEELQLLSGFLGINHADLRSELGEHWWPNRGLGPIPPTDPVIYRLYEVRPF